MFFVNKTYQSFLEVKKSKFYSFLLPYKDFNQTLNNLKKTHPKARHFVTAFRYYNEFNQIIESSNDDGEPKGTSGKPTLKVLQGHNLINTAIITVRYFGGTLLGTGGLVKAYSDSANLVIANSELLLYENLLEEYINIDYQKSSKCEYLFKKYNIEVLERSFLDGITYKIRGNKENLNSLRKIIFSS